MRDKIELGDELIKILVNSFVEMCQEVPRAKTAREQFLPPVASVGNFNCSVICSREYVDVLIFILE